MNPTATTRADLHCHSTASAVSKLGVQRALGLPECATPPEEVYELAKRRGMDFVTITDHDTIDGVLEISDRADVFVSEELTAWFRGEPQAVHVLCYGIDADDHEWLQLNASDVELCAEYLHAHKIACALAHPFYPVEAPLTARHRRILAELFPVWETRNGSRARELNMPASIYIETRGGAGVGGSDDHAGVDIGRTYTETPHCETVVEFLAHLRGGRTSARGDQGSAAKWAHSAMALALRVLKDAGDDQPDPRVVLEIVERVIREADVRGGEDADGLGPRDASNLLRAWLASLDFDLSPSELIAYFQDENFSHAELYRRARHAHEQSLRTAVATAVDAARPGGDPAAALRSMFAACLPVVPYAPAAAFLGREKAKLAARDGEPERVAIVADCLGGMHGVTHTLDEIRARGVPGFEVEVIGTDASVDRRLPAVADVDLPYYAGLKVGVPTLPAMVETLADGRYDLLQLCSPGPAGVAAGLVARVMGIPVVASYHTELGAYAGLRSGDPRLRVHMDAALALFYGSASLVLSPSAAADRSLLTLGLEPQRIARWDRGVDLSRFGPEHRRDGLLPGEVNILYAGRLTREKGVHLLADAFLAAQRCDPRLQLVLAGGGPEESELRARLGTNATFLGWLDGHELAQAYASADVFLFASTTDTFGQVILEAQASGLPVVAVDRGGPIDLIEQGRTGFLCPATAEGLADCLLELAQSETMRARLGAAARASVAERTWEAALARLAAGYRRVLADAPAARANRAA